MVEGIEAAGDQIEALHLVLKRLLGLTAPELAEILFQGQGEIAVIDDLSQQAAVMRDRKDNGKQDNCDSAGLRPAAGTKGGGNLEAAEEQDESDESVAVVGVVFALREVGEGAEGCAQKQAGAFPIPLPTVPEQKSCDDERKWKETFGKDFSQKVKVIGSIQTGVGGGDGSKGEEEAGEGTVLDEEDDDGEGDQARSGGCPGEIRDGPDGGCSAFPECEDEKNEAERCNGGLNGARKGRREAEEEKESRALATNGGKQGGTGHKEEGGHDFFAFGGVIRAFDGVHQQE